MLLSPTYLSPVNMLHKKYHTLHFEIFLLVRVCQQDKMIKTHYIIFSQVNIYPMGNSVVHQIVTR